MIQKLMFPALLFFAVPLMLACQLVRPPNLACRVNMPGVGWTQHRDGDEISYMVDQIKWQAKVDCNSSHLVDGQPLKPAGAREISLEVADTVYRLTTTDAHMSMAEYRENGSHVRIDVDDRYYVAVLTASRGGFGQAVVSYFLGGQAAGNIVRMYCYNQTRGEAHTPLLSLSAMWSESNPVTVNLVCSARDFILELSTNITSTMLKEGPTAPAFPMTPTTSPAPSSRDADRRVAAK
jgi:hypothetical protein